MPRKKGPGAKAPAKKVTTPAASAAVSTPAPPPPVDDLSPSPPSAESEQDPPQADPPAPPPSDPPPPPPAEPVAQKAPDTWARRNLDSRDVDSLEGEELRAYAARAGISKRDIENLTPDRLKQNIKASIANYFELLLES